MIWSPRLLVSIIALIGATPAAVAQQAHEGRPKVAPPAEELLSDRLERTDGIIVPPNPDTDRKMQLPPPAGGALRVIPPPLPPPPSQSPLTPPEPLLPMQQK